MGKYAKMALSAVWLVLTAVSFVKIYNLFLSDIGNNVEGNNFVYFRINWDVFRF